jgi:nitrogen regulatory protein PII
MKIVVAIIKPFKIQAVQQALNDAGVHGMTVSEVKGYGRQKGHTELYRGTEYKIDFVPKLRIEVAIDDDQLDAVLEALQTAARTDTLGDGKIFVLPLEEAVRIRTGEQGPDAL